MEIPILSPCGHWNLIDPEGLEKRPFSGLYTVSGYICQECGQWKPWFYSNRSLDEKLRHLSGMRPDHPSFFYYFVKARKRAEEIQKTARGLNKGANGKIGN